MYVADTHDLVRREDLGADGIESNFIELRTKISKSMLISTVYKHPDSSAHLSNNFKHSLHIKLSLATKEKKELIFLGDLNVNYSSKPLI